LGVEIGDSAQSREEWRELIEEVKSHPGKQYHWKNKKTRKPYIYIYIRQPR
jgi:hypothetical protein